METHLKEAQLKYLQAQINPHFLFNCLNAGAQLAMLEDAERTGVFLEKMADFFRYNVRKMEDDALLWEEVDAVDNYIYILNVRFAGDINYEKDVDEGIGNFRIPSMILQPLVENALYHGIKNKRGKGMIRIEGELDGEDCILLITDNGKGMTPERLEQVRKGIRNRKARETDIYGLYNVNERIRLNFGENYGITITSTYGEGTCVTVRLPQY